jgi:hypothetical protein
MLDVRDSICPPHVLPFTGIYGLCSARVIGYAAPFLLIKRGTLDHRLLISRDTRKSHRPVPFRVSFRTFILCGITIRIDTLLVKRNFVVSTMKTEN